MQLSELNQPGTYVIQVQLHKYSTYCTSYTVLALVHFLQSPSSHHTV